MQIKVKNWLSPTFRKSKSLIQSSPEFSLMFSIALTPVLNYSMAHISGWNFQQVSVKLLLTGRRKPDVKRFASELKFIQQFFEEL